MSYHPDEILEICVGLKWGSLGGFLASLFFIFLPEIPSRDYVYLYLVLFLVFTLLPRFLADPVSEGDGQ